MAIKKFKDFLKENKEDLYRSAKSAKKFGIDTDYFEIKVTHDWDYIEDGSKEFQQNYTINGKEYSDQDEEGWFFLLNIAKEMGLEREVLEEWFEETYDFSMQRIETFHDRGKKGDIDSVEVIEVKEAD